jgi:putative transposase
LGLWIGTGGEGATYWLGVLNEIKNRGVDDVCIVVCDGLKGLGESIGATWPLAVVQTCVLHLIRNAFRLAGRRDWDRMARDVRPIYTAVNETDAARYRRATRARGHFPNEQVAMKCLYLVIRSLDPKGTGQERWMNRWKPALNAFAMTCEGRLF